MAMEKPEDRPDQLTLLAKYIINSVGVNVGYASSYVTCECLNLLVCVVNLFMTDYFLNYEFSTYGIEVSVLANALSYHFMQKVCEI